jgi:lipid A 3-O-deacylase
MPTVLRLAFVLLLIGVSVDHATAEVQTYSDNDTDAYVPGPGSWDRNYTQGMRVNRFAAPNALPVPVRWLADRLPGFGAGDAERQFGLASGQEIYTPDAISTRTPIFDDRPYAGWLYVGGILTRRDERVMRSLEVQIGMTGPASHAADVQRWWHYRLGVRQPRGWKYQLRDEPGLVVSCQQRWRPWGHRRYLDLVPHGGVTLGNVHTEANLGGTLRLGLPLPDDFGPWRNAPATSTRTRFDLYVFARAEGRGVARNLFLDGNTFQRSQRVTRIPMLFEAQLGAAARWRRLGLRYTFSYTTHEFRERPYSAKYGSFAVVI